MRIKGQVIAVNANTWAGKHGEKTDQLVTLLDVDVESRFLNTIDYVCTPEEAKKPPLVNAVIEVGVTDIQTGFGGRYRLKGRIVNVISGK